MTFAKQIEIEQPEQESKAAPEPSIPAKLSFLMTPAVDRTIAVIACLPFLWQLYYRYRQNGFDPSRMVLAVYLLFLVVPMAFRRPPVRVTRSRWRGR